MSKVTMQDIANAVGVSRVTVWKVFNNHDGVSSAVRESVLDKARELGYPKTNTEPFTRDPAKTVSLIVSRPDSSTFWTNIIHRMAQELSLHNVNLMYTYMPTRYADDFSLPSVLTDGSVQGAVILNVYDAKLVSLINDLELPKVFLDTTPSLSHHSLRGDLILLEGHSTIYQITESVIARGLTNIGFIGDTYYARTNLERFEGFLQCMMTHGLPIDERICLTHSIGIFSYYQEICGFLDSIDVLPQAFVCASDYIAHFLRTYFTEHPERIPAGIMVTGYDASCEHTNIEEQITTADVKTSILGKRLSVQIIYRMEHADAPYELSYIYPSIIYRDSMLY